MMGKTMRKPLSVIVGFGDEPPDSGDDMAMDAPTDEQVAAGEALAKAIKSGNGGDIYSAFAALDDLCDQDKGY